MTTGAATTRQTARTVLEPCPECASEKIYTVGFRGEWWCECRLCGEHSRRTTTPAGALAFWQDHAHAERLRKGFPA